MYLYHWISWIWAIYLNSAQCLGLRFHCFWQQKLFQICNFNEPPLKSGPWALKVRQKIFFSLFNHTNHHSHSCYSHICQIVLMNLDQVWEIRKMSDWKPPSSAVVPYDIKNQLHIAYCYGFYIQWEHIVILWSDDIIISDMMLY